MKRPQVFIATDNLNMGGSQKSLLAFLQYIEELCDVDVLVWQKREREILTLPDTVRRINIPGGVGVRASVRRYGINSREFVCSVLGTFRKNHWLARPRINKNIQLIFYLFSYSPGYLRLAHTIIPRHTASARHNRFLIRLIIFSNRSPGSCPLPCRKGAGPASSQCITELFYHASVEMQGKRRDRRRETDSFPVFSFCGQSVLDRPNTS